MYSAKFHPPTKSRFCELCGDEYMPLGNRSQTCQACKAALTKAQINRLRRVSLLQFRYYRHYKKTGIRQYIPLDKPLKMSDISDASQCKSGCMYHSYCGTDACCMYTAIKGYTRRSVGDNTPCGKKCKSYKKGKSPLFDFTLHIR